MTEVMGFLAHMSVRNGTDGHTGKYKNRKIYYIEIYGFESLNKWVSEIGFSNIRHLNKLPR